MKKSAPNSLGIIAIAALFGLVALVVAYALLHFAGMASFVIGLIVAIITAIVLWMGWGDTEAGSHETDNMAASSGVSAPSASPAPKPTPAAPMSSGTTTSATTSPAAPAPVTAAPVAKAEPKAETVTEAPKKAAPKADAKPKAAAKTTAKASTTSKSAAKPKAAKPKAAKATEKATPKVAAKAAPKATAKPAAKVAPKRAPVAADGKPEMLAKPRGGAGDDLKQIKGVGPKMETMLNTMGVWHFDQVAGWRKKEVEWVDDNLEGFKGRVSRDEWVKQAKVLAKGGTTEFSKKVKKGGVY